MNQKEISKVLECYGLERLLEDNERTLPEILEILEELGFLNFDMYECDDANHSFSDKH